MQISLRRLEPETFRSRVRRSSTEPSPLPRNNLRPSLEERVPESEAGGVRRGLTEARRGNITDGQLGSGLGWCRRVLSVCGRPQPVQMAIDPVPQGFASSRRGCGLPTLFFSRQGQAQPSWRCCCPCRKSLIARWERRRRMF